MSEPFMVEVVRGRDVESRHAVDVVVVDRDGVVAESWGDATRGVLPRSSLKPIQAQVLVTSGAADAIGLTDRRLALACASHGGEAGHVDEVSTWLAELGLEEGAFECGAHAPLHRPSADALMSSGLAFDARHNNCSGKHCGFLTVCLHEGLDVAGYILPDHPLQRDHVTPAIEELCGLSLRDQVPGVDGCGIPVWTIPLDLVARGWARLAAEPAGRRVVTVMAAEPFMVAGAGRACTTLMERGAGRVAAKTGAEGVFCAVDLETGSAVALKVRDGATRASEVSIAWLLERLGVLNAGPPTLLHNWAGTEVGVVRVTS